MKNQVSAICILVCCLSSLDAQGEKDWPTWRYDGNRSANSTHQLPEQLEIEWVRKLPQISPAWPEDKRLGFDRQHEPVVAGHTLLLASTSTDSVTAFDTRSGRRLWRTFAEAPVRFAPAIHQEKAYFGSDDGHLYCVNLADGQLQWKFDARITPRRVIGNERLISVWPVRGAPVIIDDMLYFTVGVWPFEGTYLYALDLNTADKSTVPQYKRVTLPDLTPQGYLAVNDKKLFIPCGRASAYSINRQTWNPVKLRYNGRGKTDYHLATQGRWMFHAERVVNIDAGTTAALVARRPILDGNIIYRPSREGTIVATDFQKKSSVKYKDRRGKEFTATTYLAAWELAAQRTLSAAGMPPEPATDRTLSLHIKAGNRLYGNYGNILFAVDLAEKEAARIAWAYPLEKKPSTMIAADDRLFVTTESDELISFADARTTTGNPRYFPVNPDNSSDYLGVNDETSKLYQALVASGKGKSGYHVFRNMRLRNGLPLIQSVLRATDAPILFTVTKNSEANRLREFYTLTGIYGHRLTVLSEQDEKIQFPPYLADLLYNTSLPENEQEFRENHNLLRPYGGSWFLASSPQLETVQSLAENFRDSNTAVERGEKYFQDKSPLLIRRKGALPGAADWTHEYGDPANTLMSRDKLVKAPLGVLWFGGPSSRFDNYFDRHDWGPSLAVIEGRMFIQGPEKLSAVDIYTGRALWQRTIDKGLGFGRRANWTPSGFHFVATKQAIYLAYPEHCDVIDPASGKTLRQLKLPDPEDRWGRIRVHRNNLIVSVFRKVEGESKPVPNKIVAVDSTSGKAAWDYTTEKSFPIMAIGADKIFCYEGKLENLFNNRRRQGRVPKSDPVRQIRAIDANTGASLWDRSVERISTWIAYSSEHDVLIASNKEGISAMRGKDGEKLWEKTAHGVGFRGHPENYWDKVILWKDRVIDQRGPGGSYNIKTGESIVRKHPITGKPVSWNFTKTGHHCNYAIASPHLMTFRASTAGYYDMNREGTGRLVGFRSGCRNSLIPAGGVLNAPNFASGCICSYSIFTSLALVHVPENDTWTYTSLAAGKDRIEQLGLNLGAPGDRLAQSGTLWLDYPSNSNWDRRYPKVSGPSPDPVIFSRPEKPDWFQNPPSDIQSIEAENRQANRWVYASGAEGLESLTVDLKANENALYDVELHFADPSSTAAGQRVMNIVVGDKKIEKLDIFRESGGLNRPLIKTIEGVQPGRRLVLRLEAVQGKTILCGIRILARNAAEPRQSE